MPGMMDTVLNLGLNDETVEALAERRGRRALRLRQLPPLHPDVFERRARHRPPPLRGGPRRRTRTGKGYTLDTDLDRRRLEGAGRALQGDRREASSASPSRRTRSEQLWGAIGAVFGSWMNAARHHLPRAERHPRRAGARPSTCRRWCSATWARPRPPASPSPAIPRPARSALYGEFLINAQGEDVVAGIRTPQDITEAARIAAGSDKPSMERRCRRPFAELVRIYGILEKHYRDMQDIEFTIESGKLWMLQTRNGKRTAKAALQIAVEMASEGLITRGRGGRAASIRPRSTSSCIRRIDPEGRAQGHRARACRPRPARRRARSCSTPTRPEAAQEGRPQGHPGARRDQPGGHPRHACRRGHPHHARRHDLPRRRRRARHGQALRLRRRRDPRRLRRRRR